MSDRSTPLSRYFVLAAFLQIVWGLVPSASKIVIEEIPVELYIALRWTISSLVIAAILLIRTRSLVPMRRDAAIAGGLGILGYALSSFGTLYALKLGGVANFGLMTAFGPVVTVLFSFWLLRERPSARFYAVLPVCIVAVLLLVMGKHRLSGWNVAFSVACLVLGAAALESLVFIYSKRLRSQLSTFQYMMVAQASAASFMWAMQLLFFHQTHLISNLSVNGWMAAFFVSIVACVLCYALLYFLLQRIEGHRLALFDGLHTVSSTLCGVVWFGDVLNTTMLAGGTLLLAGLIVGNWPTAARIPRLE